MPGILIEQSAPPPPVTSLASYFTPPLLSRLPAALLASPDSAPTPIVDASKLHIGWTESHLPDIDQASLALHYALYTFRAVDSAYATRPYVEAFNWPEILLPKEVERKWYIVAFRSIRRKDANTEHLYKADREAHEEAVTAGGLILYWYGAVNEAGENLATCIWQSRAHAIAANRYPKHATAARLASATYEVYALERYILRKEKGSQKVIVEEYEGGDVGF